MESLKKNKILLSAFAITLIAFIYFMFFSGGGSANTSVLSDAGTGVVAQTDDSATAQTPAGQEILNMLAQLDVVQINTNLFSEPSWISLQNFETALPSNSPGKADLFSPIGQSGISLPPPVQPSKKP